MTDTTRTRTTPPGRTLHRSREERIFAGVAGGLSEHLGINAWWFRWAFIILSFFGGFGLLVYIAAWLVIPDADSDDPVISDWAKKLDTRDGGTIFGMVLIGVAAVILFSRIANVSGTLIVAAILFVVGMLLYRGDLRVPGSSDDEPDGVSPSDDDTREADDAIERDDGNASPEPAVVAAAPSRVAKAPKEPKPPKERSVLGRLTIAVGLIVVAAMGLIDASALAIDIEPVHYIAAAMAVVAGGLLVGAWIGRARWLIVVGLLILPALFAASLVPSSLNWTAGETVHRPLTVDQVASPYELGAGQLTIDLTALTTAELAEIGQINASLGAGEMIVRLPPDVTTEVVAEVGIGSVEGPFSDAAGVGVSTTKSVGAGPHVLTLDLEVGAGVITITGSSIFGGNN